MSAESDGETRDSDGSFFVLWSKHQRTVLAYLVTLVGDPNDAEDLLQETAMVLWRKRGSFDGRSQFTSWACGVARLEALTFLRRRAKMGQAFSDELFEHLADRLEDRLEKQPTLVEDRRRALQECLKQLDGKQHALLRLRYYEGISAATIAKRLSATADTIHGKLKRLRAKLASCIDYRLRA